MPTQIDYAGSIYAKMAELMRYEPEIPDKKYLWKTRTEGENQDEQDDDEDFEEEEEENN